MVTVEQVATIRRKFEAIREHLDERGRRLFAAAEVRALGHGGLQAVAQATGIARSTIGRGLKDLDRPALPVGRVRRGGCGQRPLIERDPTLLDDLRGLLAPMTIGDPMRPLLWVSKSHGKLAAALREMGHRIGPSTVAKLLLKLGYSRQCNSKVNAGGHHVDRDAQFEHINTRVLAFQAEGLPVISVDTKKKELIGPFKQPGTDYRPQGKPLRVSTHDYPIPEKGKVVPYGIYDIGDNSGWVSVG
ncbi:MAG: ISAzo13 family transposase, partial [Alphaproteobacteria bacterium]